MKRDRVRSFRSLVLITRTWGRTLPRDRDAEPMQAFGLAPFTSRPFCAGTPVPRGPFLWPVYDVVRSILCTPEDTFWVQGHSGGNSQPGPGDGLCADEP